MVVDILSAEPVSGPLPDTCFEFSSVRTVRACGRCRESELPLIGRVAWGLGRKLQCRWI
jgi:hypothetical protein